MSDGDRTEYKDKVKLAKDIGANNIVVSGVLYPIEEVLKHYPDL